MYAADRVLSKLIANLVEDSLLLTKWFAVNHIKANPDKFQAIAVGKRTKDQNIVFSLENNVIYCEDHVKLLGVTIDFKLNFDLHISNVCKKASRQLNVLKRIGRNLCRLGKLNVYYSFIMSNFNYCPLVRHCCGEVNTKKIEKIQERALTFIYQDYNSSYDILLSRSQLPSLRVRRLRTIALEAFKILNNQTPEYLNDLLTYKSHSYSFRHTDSVEVPQVRTSTYGVRPSRSAAAKMWNSLPQEFREITSRTVQVSDWCMERGICTCSFCSSCKILCSSSCCLMLNFSVY